MERMSKIKDKCAGIIQCKYVISAAKAHFISGNNLALQFCTEYICKGSRVSLKPAQHRLLQRALEITFLSWEQGRDLFQVQSFSCKSQFSVAGIGGTKYF